MPKKYKVHESRKRSLLKTIGVRAIEITGDTLVLGFIFNQVLKFPVAESYGLGFGITLIVDVICLVLTYLWERLWARIDYGRYVHERGKKCKECRTH